jgi:flagella basal body P-ring formation protein FlgA
MKRRRDAAAGAFSPRWRPPKRHGFAAARMQAAATQTFARHPRVAPRASRAIAAAGMSLALAMAIARRRAWHAREHRVMNRKRISAGLGLLVLLHAGASIAAENGIEDHEGIRGAAETYAADIATNLAPAGASIRATATRLDPRLRLPACSAALTAFGMSGQTGIPSSVGVRCDGERPWSIYVPVRVEVIADVVVLAAVAERGAALRAEQLRLEPRDVGGLIRGYLTDVAATEGMVLTRPLQPGAVLDPTMLAPERIVVRGERVQVRAGSPPLGVSMQGEALADAARGERVRVRNMASGTVVEGIVAEAGVVQIRR